MSAGIAVAVAVSAGTSVAVAVSAGSGVAVAVSAGIGVAVAVPETGLDIKLAMAQADEALYRAKSNGRDRFAV